MSSPRGKRVNELTQRVTGWLRRRVHQPCPRCSFELHGAPLYREWRVCDNCGHHFPLDAVQRLKTLADHDSFHELEKYVFAAPRGIEYSRRLRKARRETHIRESVILGTAKIEGCAVLVVVLDFRFLGGTMGAAAGEKIARAFEIAVEKRLPVIAVTASGGARIQEGMVALMQMAKTAAAVNRFQESGLPYIAVLANPTTGGVYASFANLADVILAEPRALIGFSGPRVVEILSHEKLPPDSHRAETLLAHGMIDAVVPRTELRGILARLIAAAQAQERDATRRAEGVERDAPPDGRTADAPESRAEPESSWANVQHARHPQRPTMLDYVRRIFSDFVELHGDRSYGDDAAVVGGLARLELGLAAAPSPPSGTTSLGVVVIGHERGHAEERAARHGGRAGPEGYRKAERLLQLASKWQLPVITFIDTPGADNSYAAEQRGIATALAHALATMLETRAPTLAVITGEGGSGGALALAAADRVGMLEHAVYSVISPEGASAILFGDDAHARELADDLHLTARELLERRIVDELIPEPEGGAEGNADAAAAHVRRFIERTLQELIGMPTQELLQARYKKYRSMGNSFRQ